LGALASTALLILLSQLAGQVPERAMPHFLTLVSEAHRAGRTEWIRELAAQVDAESAWNPDAESPFARGLAQFTPATAADWDHWCKGWQEAGSDWRHPKPQLRCQIAYLEWISRFLQRSDLDSWEGRWAAYNAGPGWVPREAEAGRCLRSQRACEETAGYVRRIRELMQHYPAAP